MAKQRRRRSPSRPDQVVGRAQAPREKPVSLLVIAAVAGACCLLGWPVVSALWSKPSAPPKPTALQPLREFQRIRWGAADTPGDMVASTRGAVWIADASRATVSLLQNDGKRREYPLADIDETTSTYDKAIVSLAAGPSGSAWMVVTDEEPPTGVRTLLIGLAPDGRELARRPVPETGTLGIDGSGHVWIVPSLSSSRPGMTAYSVGLRSGKVRSFRAFPGTNVGIASLMISPDGTAWVEAETGTPRARGFVLGMLTQHGVVARPVVWPRTLSAPVGAMTVFDRTGAMWVGYYGGLARVDEHGAVQTYPLFPGAYIVDMENEPDGRVAFSIVIGPQGDMPRPFQSITNPLYIGEFDPGNLRQLPTLQLQPPRKGRGNLAVGELRDATVDTGPDHLIYRIPLSIPYPATLPDRAYPAATKQVLNRFQTRATAIRRQWGQRGLGDGRGFAQAISALVDQTTRRLHHLTFDGKAVPDPAIARLARRIDSDGLAIRKMLDVAVPFPRDGARSSHHEILFETAYQFLAGQMTADMGELRAHLHLAPMSYDGKPTWQPARG